MTAAERQQRRRGKIKGRLPPRGSKERLRIEVWRFLRAQASLHPKLDVAHLELLLDDLRHAIRMDAYCYSVGHGHRCNYQTRYLDPRESTETDYSCFKPEPEKLNGYTIDVLDAIDHMTAAEIEGA